MMGVAARGNKLVFHVGQDRVELHLGPDAAQRWAKAIASPLPDLASKLGISSTTRLSVLGNVVSEELQAAVDQGMAARGKEVDLTLICANTQSEVDDCFARQTLGGPYGLSIPKERTVRSKNRWCATFFAATASSTPRSRRYQPG
jgi:hypothetical protein